MKKVSIVAAPPSRKMSVQKLTVGLDLGSLQLVLRAGRSWHSPARTELSTTAKALPAVFRQPWQRVHIAQLKLFGPDRRRTKWAYEITDEEQMNSSGLHMRIRILKTSSTDDRTHVNNGSENESLQINRRTFCNELLLTSTGIALTARTVVGESLSPQDSMLAYPPMKIEGARN